MAADPFAGLPRLTPLSDDIADLLEPDFPPPRPKADAASTGAKKTKDSKSAKNSRLLEESRRDEQARAVEDPRSYIGRRRAVGEEQPEQATGGRRRAPDDAPDDLLTRLRGH
jgi:hypothetical protein